MSAKHCPYLPEPGTLNLLNTRTSIAISMTKVGPHNPFFSLLSGVFACFCPGSGGRVVSTYCPGAGVCVSVVVVVSLRVVVVVVVVAAPAVPTLRLICRSTVPTKSPGVSLNVRVTMPFSTSSGMLIEDFTIITESFIYNIYSIMEQCWKRF